MGFTPQQKDAIRIRDKTLLVSAAAGSGKTRVLTERIILSLLGKLLPENEREDESLPNEALPADLSRMLIVTFTRAAAAELKARIATALNDALAKNPDNKHLSDQLFLLGSAQISTIDSFFQKAVKANFEKVDLPATFRIADERELEPLKKDLIEELVEEFYARHSASEEDAPISRIQKNGFARALDHLISNRSDGKLCDVLLEFYNGFSGDRRGIRALGEYADQLRLDAEREIFDTGWGKVLHAHIREIFEGYRKHLSDLLQALEDCDTDRAKYGNVIRDDLALCDSILEAVDQRDYEEIRTRTAKPVFARMPNKEKEPTARIRVYRGMRDKFKSDVKSVSSLLCCDKERISEQCAESAETFSVLCEFFLAYETRLMAEKQSRGAFEFNDIRAKLYRLLFDENDTPTPYAAELASQYDIVYIDEYQDVDGIQDGIFAQVGSKCRFMVGDIKQSIYGFRGGNPSIFSGYRKRFPLYDRNDPEATESAREICVFMSANFRCNEPIIRFANRVCAFLFSACKESIDYRDEDDLVFKKPMPPTLPDGHPVPVRVELFEPKPKSGASTDADAAEDGEEIGNDEVRWVATEIARLLREEVLEVPHDKSNPPPEGKHELLLPSDIAILTRSREQGKKFANALTALGIPVANAAQNDVLRDPILIATVNLLRAVDNPYRDLPLTEFLLSELGGFTLSEIVELRNACKEGALYDALILASRDRTNQRVAELLDALEHLRTQAAVLPADKFLRVLYADQRLAPYATAPSLLFLYDQARACQRTAFCGLYGFLSHLSKVLEDKKTSVEGFKKADSAVQIMTIHHSKGLEFPVVFYGGLGGQFNAEDQKKTLLYHREVGVATKLYNRESGALEDTVPRNALKLRIKEEQAEEEIRALYVALTRAGERLYVTGTLRGGYDSVRDGTESITYGNRHAILSASSPLKWLLAALRGGSETDPYILTVHPAGSVRMQDGDGDGKNSPKVSPVTQNERALHYASIAKKQAELAYPDAHLAGLPSKLAASKLHRDVLDKLESDGDTDRASEAMLELMRSRPSFSALLGQSKRPSATDIGTATHTFLEFCDFERLRLYGVAAECERLTDETHGFLSKEEAGLLDERALQAFCDSDLMQMILSAKEVRREQKFSILLPMSELTQKKERAEALADEQIFVQGSIDMLLTMEDGRRILVDYKTDRLHPEELADPVLLRERFRRDHGDQLNCYARAVRRLFGKAPDEVRIYSFPLGATVRIDA